MDSFPLHAAIVVVGGLLVPALVALVLWGLNTGDAGTSRGQGAAATESPTPRGEVQGGTPTTPVTPTATATGTPRPADASPEPAASTPAPPAGGAGVEFTFDEGITGAPIEGWRINSGATFTIAPLPTAVQRSALLETDGPGSVSACYPLAGSGEITFEATFRATGAATIEIPLLALVMSDGSAATLNTAGDQLSLAGSSVPLNPEAWYRWTVTTAGDGSYEMTLADDEGAELARGSADAGEAAVSSFCATVRSGISVYLDRVAVTAGAAGG